MGGNYIDLKDLEVYKLSRKLSMMAWTIYENLSWQDRKIMGDQFIESTDSIGANIAEGYRRFHYLDRIKFYYTSRASISESIQHWLDLLCERKKVSEELKSVMTQIAERLSVKLSNFINVTYKAKDNQSQ